MAAEKPLSFGSLEFHLIATMDEPLARVTVTTLLFASWSQVISPEGNPDHPIVIGSVYHGTNRLPYSLPDEKTKTTIKSNRSKGGDGFNEIRLEDKKGFDSILSILL